ncbi:hypothetical protein [Actinoplanes sp. DH11]|uniref:hypothetical protein n=1 Tax=Actinoplanes sp. DH11 TaxID=2857011 RepID=UPI001E32F473|nr:hypothetical protein [Actinoplanes sp. DH11]
MRLGVKEVEELAKTHTERPDGELVILIGDQVALICLIAEDLRQDQRSEGQRAAWEIRCETHAPIGEQASIVSHASSAPPIGCELSLRVAASKRA